MKVGQETNNTLVIYFGLNNSFKEIIKRHELGKLPI